MHSESGFVRLSGTDRVELVLADPLGLASIAEGLISCGFLCGEEEKRNRVSVALV